MLHITQGHEKGIGLEVFFKSLLFLPQFIIDDIVLYASQESCHRTLKTLSLPYLIHDDAIEVSSKKIKLHTCQPSLLPESTNSLNLALSYCQKKDILITLPTSKDQLYYKNKSCAGYTDFFRNYFSNNNISMIFMAHNLFLLLLSDHIPLSKVTTYLNQNLIEEKINLTLKYLEHYFNIKFDEILLSGINPHSGENGILGKEDDLIKKIIANLQNKISKMKITGPHPGDTLHFLHKHKKKQLFIYSFHDQGLPYFKNKYHLFGLNITLGLPFLRMSVDHGTAFHLFGKNLASSEGCLYVINEAYRISHISKD